jgi:hypothetical protein
VINVLQLQTVRDGGILDPDDFIQDVVEDKELVNKCLWWQQKIIMILLNVFRFFSLKLIAIYEEINYENQLLLKTDHHNIPDQHLKNPVSNSLDNSSLSQTSSNSTNCSNSVITSIMTANTVSFLNNQADKFYRNNQFCNSENNSFNNRSMFQNSPINSHNQINNPDHEPSNQIKPTFSPGSNTGKLILKTIFIQYLYTVFFVQHI